MIRTLLIANRGEIAIRIMRAAHDLGMRTVAVYADPDVNAAHVRAADRAVPLNGTTGGETYLDKAKIIAAAQRTGADAIHPGYGFLAENADFAEQVTATGLIWVGPPPSAIRAMGDKLTALESVTAAGVPTLPRAPVADLEAATREAERIGFPLIIKASAGGGGKGMRVIGSLAELPAALAGAQREAASAFGDDTIFLERFVTGARHIEVQVFGDAQGHVRHLFERECSIQRRHQKVIEEAPSPFVDAALREQIGSTAAAAAAAVSYVGAGTVELIMGADHRFYFLEMNTRLQVEHPVTELVTGTDLVRQQLLVAQGLAPEFDDVRLAGSAIEARVYAEDPEADFLPQAGHLFLWEEPEGVRVDSGVASGDDVSPYFDPMLAKIIAYGADRDEATAKLARALRELRVQGLKTNREFLINVLEHPAFRAGDTTIDFIERVNPARGRTPSDEELRRAALAAALHDRANTPRTNTFPQSWGHPLGGERFAYRHGERTLEVRYHEERDGSIAATVDGVDMRVRGLEIDGIREPLTVSSDGTHIWVHSLEGEVALTEVPRFPKPEAEVPTGSLVAPMNGAVVAVQVAVGDSVEVGQVVLVLEAMKMEHQIAAPVAGVVTELHASLGETVAADAVLAVVEDGHGPA